MTSEENSVFAQGDAEPTRAKPVPNSVGAASSKAAVDIGHGPGAPTNIVYYAIRWSFLAAAGTTAALLLARVIRPEVDFGISAKDIWTLLIPVITAGLGYLFGKNQ